MPEYLSPGVYIEEIEIGAKPIEGVNTSIAGFIGLTERGTEKPTLVTGFNDFQRKFGTYVQESYLAYAVEGFFRNGGQKCFVSRIIKGTSTSNRASLILNNVKIEAVGGGAWGNSIAIRIEDASLKNLDANLFKITVIFWSKNVLINASFTPSTGGEKIAIQVDEIKSQSGISTEEYDNLSKDPQSPDFYIKKVTALSNLIGITLVNKNLPPDRPSNIGYPNTTNFLFEKLTGGSDGSTALTQSDFIGENTKDNCTGLNALDKVEEISILYLPDLHVLNDPDQVINETIAHCENLKNRILIIDAKKNSYYVSTLFAPASSKYAAFYYPWIKAYNPLTRNEDLFPPGGFVAGIYARSDTERGVHKAPANEIVRGASGIEVALTKGEQDLLNARGINCIRFFQGRGVLLWGARTTAHDPLWKYINVRRLFIYLEESIKAGTQWVVFEPSNEKLWNRVKQTIAQFLTTQWKSGALMGKTPEEAFFVKCDRTTMTQDDIDNGRLIVVIGIAPTKPAEFVIFKIAQWQGGSAATE